METRSEIIQIGTISGGLCPLPQKSNVNHCNLRVEFEYLRNEIHVSRILDSFCVF
jgi:hypothetical protein